MNELFFGVLIFTLLMVSFVTIISVATRIYAIRTRSPVNRAYVVYAASMGVILLIYLLLFTPFFVKEVAPHLYRILHFFHIFGAGAFLTFAYYFVNRKKDTLYSLVIIVLSIAGLLTLFTNLVITDTPLLAGRFYTPELGPLSHATYSIYAVFTLGLSLFGRAAFKTKSKEQRLALIKYIIGMFIVFATYLVSSTLFKHSSWIASIMPTVEALLTYYLVMKFNQFQITPDEIADSLFEHAPEGFIITRPNGNIITANRHAECYLDVREDDIRGWHITEIFPFCDHTQESATYEPEEREGRHIYLKQTTVRKFETVIGKLFIMQDVTEIKEKEYALRESEKRFELAIDAAEEGLWENNLKTGEAFMSDKTFTMLGYEPQPSSNAMEFFSNVIHPDDLSLFDETLARYQRGELASYTMEFRIQARNKTWRHILAKGNCFEWDEDGKPQRFVGTYSDITERKEMERALRENEEKLKTILENLPIGVMTCDTKGTITFVGGTFLENTKKHDILGTSIFKLPAAKRPDAASMPFDVQQIAKRIMRGESVTLSDMRFGDEFVDAIVTPMRSAENEIIGAIWISIDVTDQHEAERALRDREQRLTAIFNNAGVGIALFDENERISHANTPWCTLFGYETQKAILGKTIEEIVALDKCPEEPRFVRNVLLGANEHVHMESCFARHDGATFWASVSVTPLHDDKGNVTGVVCIIVDVSERKEVEEIMQRRAQADEVMSKILRVLLEEDVDTAITKGLKSISRFLGISHSDILLFDDEKETFSMVYEYCEKGHTHQRERFQQTPMRDYLPLIRRIQKGEAVCRNRLDSKRDAAILKVLDARVTKEYHHAHTVLYIPIFYRNKVVGTVEILSDGEEGPGKEAVGFVTRFGESIAFALARKYAERALRESERKFREMSDLLPQTVYELTLEGKVTFLNSAGKHLLGYDEKDIVEGFDALDIFLPEDKETVRRAISGKMENTDQKGREYTIVTHDGRHIPVMIYGAPVFNDDTLVGTRGVIIDITERIAAERQLRESEQKFRETTDLLPQTVYELDREGRVTFLNKAGRELFGYSENDIVKGVSAFSFFTDEDAAFVKEELSCCDNDRPDRRHAHTLTIRRADGTHVPVMIYDTPIIHDGEFDGTRGVIIDISEQKQVEETLREAAEAAKAATKAKSDFLANMSHEIRTPMNAIIGMAELALRQPVVPKVKEYLEIIDNSSKSLLGIINDILDFSKIEAGKLEIEEVDFYLADTLEQMSDLFRSKTAEKGIELVISAHPDVPLALIGDPLRFGQILINLISNAVKFTEQGEIVVSVACDTQSTQYATLRVSVTDSGIGIPPDRLDRLFESFTQADGSTTRRFGGTGLGLTISKSLIETMGGEITASSEEGKGSTFTFTVTLKRQPQSKERTHVLPQKLSGLKTLVVDDNKAVRVMLREILSTFTFTVSVAETGEEALRIIAEAKDDDAFQLLLVDWKLPGIDGIETIRRVKDLDAYSETPIVLMTAFGTHSDIESAEKDIDAFLMKPLKASSLFDTIVTLFDEERKKEDLVGPITKESLQKDAVKGAYVLLAEDNAINRRVALEIFKEAGIYADVAIHGRECVEKVTTADYDAVLMDIQMPLLDGYEATEKIRAIDGYEDIPIIAMTANAMKGDREKCLDAGMNDYISKPINMEELFTTLKRWVTPKPRPELAQEREHEQNANENETPRTLPDTLPGIALDKTLARLSGNKKALASILVDFADEQEHVADEIQSALAEGNLSLAHRKAHTLKGIAGNIEAEELFPIARELEEAIKTRALPRVETLLGKTRTHLAYVIGGIQRAFPKTDNATTAVSGEIKSLDRDAVAEGLTRLHALVEETNVDADEAFETLRPLFKGTRFEAAFTRVGKGIQDFDFDAALAALDALTNEMDEA